MSALNIHPLINTRLPSSDSSFSGGTIRCLCDSSPVTVQVSSNVAHNHACGCSKCYKPAGALFSVVGVVPSSSLRVTSNADKLHVVDPSAVIRRHACRGCGVHLYGRIEQDHPFRGLDFVHVELSDERGWQAPQFAAFVSSIVESGFDEKRMGEVRAKLKGLGLETYDCLSPVLMDTIASWTREKKQSKFLGAVENFVWNSSCSQVCCPVEHNTSTNWNFGDILAVLRTNLWRLLHNLAMNFSGAVEVKSTFMQGYRSESNKPGLVGSIKVYFGA